jgi:hypothetical protein
MYHAQRPLPKAEARAFGRQRAKQHVRGGLDLVIWQRRSGQPMDVRGERLSSALSDTFQGSGRLEACMPQTKKPATGVSARASDCCDDDNMPVICPTCQIFLSAEPSRKKRNLRDGLRQVRRSVGRISQAGPRNARPGGRNPPYCDAARNGGLRFDAGQCLPGIEANPPYGLSDDVAKNKCARRARSGVIWAVKPQRQ